MKNKGLDESTYKELERVENKYIVPLELYDIIKKEISKNLQPAYPDKDTKFVKLNTTYLDSNDLEFFRFHTFGFADRLKCRIRIYGANGVMDKSDKFLEIKEKQDNQVKKYRIQLDTKNFNNVKAGNHLEYTNELVANNSPLMSHTDVKRYIERYNKIAAKYEITPILTNSYTRLAYGKDALRITMDTELTFKSNRTIALSQAYKVKKSSEWSTAKEYGKKYNSSENFILEIKHNTPEFPPWLKTMLETNGLVETRFSKYVWCCWNLIKQSIGEQ